MEAFKTAEVQVDVLKRHQLRNCVYSFCNKSGICRSRNSCLCVCVHLRSMTEMIPDDFSGVLIQCVLSIHLLRQLVVVIGFSKFQSLSFWDKYPESTNMVLKSSFAVVRVHRRCDLKRSQSCTFKFKNCVNFFLSKSE